MGSYTQRSIESWLSASEEKRKRINRHFPPARYFQLRHFALTADGLFSYFVFFFTVKQAELTEEHIVDLIWLSLNLALLFYLTKEEE